MENNRKRLEMIQGVINRMISNLFFLKGWTTTLIAALLPHAHLAVLILINWTDSVPTEPAPLLDRLSSGIGKI